MKQVFDDLESSYDSANVIERFQIKASKIAFANRINRKYTYWIKTPHGMRNDTVTNEKYGSRRDDYEKWRDDHPLYQVSYSDQVSLRYIVDTTRKIVVGYVTEEKISGEAWKKDIETIVEKCFETLCEELNVNDIETFKYFVFNNEFLSTSYEMKDYDYDLERKLEMMVLTYEYYNDDEEYRNLIDKIKG